MASAGDCGIPRQYGRCPDGRCPHCSFPSPRRARAGLPRPRSPRCALPQPAAPAGRAGARPTTDARRRPRLSPPHERALARALRPRRRPTACMPWAACEARARPDAAPGAARPGPGSRPATGASATDHVVLATRRQLQLDAAESQALLAAMQPYSQEDGIALHLRRAEPLAGARRAVPRPAHRLARPRRRPRSRRLDAARRRPRALRRLQNEMQMLLYTHRVNDDAHRAAACCRSIRSGLSGTGALPADADRRSAPRPAGRPATCATPRCSDDWRRLGRRPGSSSTPARCAAAAAPLRRAAQPSRSPCAASAPPARWSAAGAGAAGAGCSSLLRAASAVDGLLRAL